MQRGYISLTWQLPLAVVAFIWAFLEEMPAAIRMAWLNSFACIKIER